MFAAIRLVTRHELDAPCNSRICHHESAAGRASGPGMSWISWSGPVLRSPRRRVPPRARHGVPGDDLGYAAHPDRGGTGEACAVDGERAAGTPLLKAAPEVRIYDTV
ncbi:hypothetical protein ACIRPT_32070 [Streptomyces sp. NPDC101227]|uniref:hypothetical protein n=1 Tax=Streptomyces sp. NPDC101227 TaxID=3366136 RepID=UPI003823BBD9